MTKPEQRDLAKYAYAIWGPDSTRIQPSMFTLSHFTLGLSAGDLSKARFAAAIVYLAKQRHMWLPFNVIDLDPILVSGLDIDGLLEFYIKEDLLYYAATHKHYLVTRFFITYCLNSCFSCDK